MAPPAAGGSPPRTDASAASEDAVVNPGDAGWLLALAGSGFFVVAAVVLEVVGATFSNSPVPDWADLAPLAWPPAARVAWWLTVAGAAGVFRLSLHRLGFRQRPIVVAASVLPFVVFASGIAVGADWSTWH